MSEIIEWSNLPDIPRITTEFIQGRAPVVSLLGGDWRKKAVLEAVGERRVNFNNISGLGDAIRTGYREIMISPRLDKNLKALNKDETLAVVTGQQVGIYGGPLYTFYKALQTILLAEQLSEIKSRTVIPIFWMETADADFEEVNRIGLPARVVTSHHLVYNSRNFISGQSINYHVFTDQIEAVNNGVMSWLKNLKFGEQLLNNISGIYKEGEQIASAFMGLLNELLGDKGLVILNPLHPAIVERTQGFWDKCLAAPEKLNKAFTLASGEVSDLNFPLQVSLNNKALPIFYIDENGMRQRIQEASQAWKTKNSLTLLNDNELREIATENPGSLSPSVLLRPLLQDWILPTWIYVGGPSEIAYHAQIGRCYDMLNIPRPLIAPRMGFTFIEPWVRKLLDKNNWTVSDVIGGREILLRSSGKARILDDLFNSGAEQLQRWQERIERAADEAALNIAMELDRASRKMNYQWEKLRKIMTGKVSERDQTRYRNSEKLLNLILPDDQLQERHDNVLYYLASYGDSLIQSISENVDLFKPQHIIIDLEVQK